MKSKKILTILLSLAIMFTFMPAMAFANYSGTDGTGKWAVDGSKYTVTINGESRDFATVRTWSSSGMITAQIKPSSKLPSEYDEFEDIAYNKEGVNSYQYVDLSNSKVVVRNDGAPDPSIDTVSYAYMTDVDDSNNAILDQDAFDVWLSKPDYVDGYDAKEDANKGASLLGLMSGTRETAALVFTSADFVFGADYTQTPTVAALVKPSKTANYETTLNYAGDIKASKFTVSGVKAFAFAIDSLTIPTGTESEGTFTFTYDGDTHTLVNNAVDGFKVEYELLDNTTNRWNAVDAVQVKDVNMLDAAGYSVRFRVKNVKKNIYVNPANLAEASEAYTPLTIKINPVATGFSFELNVGTPNKDDNLVDVGSNANPLDYVVFSGKAADKETAMKYFNDVYEVKATPSTADSTRVTWTIEKKSGVNPTAIAKTYAQFLADYTFVKEGTSYNDTTTTGSASKKEVRIGSNNKDDDISFEGQTSFTYSGKKTTKKGVLKAKKTITVKATADSGNAITYVATKTAGGKITVSAAGKITVKKGLKKGTYKVTVKAKTAAGNGYKAASEKQTYVIKIKK